MTEETPPAPASPAPEGGSAPPAKPHKRRPRYAGKNPRRFEEKYKEHDPERFAETAAKVTASGKTPAGTHRPIMVAEILATLAPAPGETGADCTLGYGGHTKELLARVQPGGRVLGLDADPIELPKTEARLRALGFGPETFSAHRSNFAGLPQVMAAAGVEGLDFVLADLGVSSMQIDDPARGFSVKHRGPLDMRMNPSRGQTAAGYLKSVSAEVLTRVLLENGDEHRAPAIAAAIAGREFATTNELATVVKAVLPPWKQDDADLTVRRVFQALRIAVNDEFSALDTLLRHLPGCLKPGGRVAILTFHSGEDRRVKKSFQAGLDAGIYAAISDEISRPTVEECASNPRAKSAKLRWAKAT